MHRLPFCASGSVVSQRPTVDGKFLAVGGQRFLVRGVTYGTFAPNHDGIQFPSRPRVAQDFAAMAAAGINTVRTYTAPPEWLLDTAAVNGLLVMVGLSWPQHTPFLDDPGLVRRIRHDVAAAVREHAAHPAVLLFALGNEIPPGVVRWHGHRRIAEFLRELHQTAKAVAPDGLFTYVNFPPTEHLDVSTFDVCAFNVYLHHEQDLRAYLARLQHVAGERPLLLAEAGSDSVREGLDGQARITAMHLRAAFEEGACGAIAYAWTDEWWRGGQPVDDWAFGLVDEARFPKPVLSAVREVFDDAPFPAAARRRWPKVSVVVCAYNAADTIDACMRSLERLCYPEVEIIVVNDGSTDATSAIAHGHEQALVIDVPNGGLSMARNVGLAYASGEIVAYTDADVRVDQDWLTYLVQPMLTSDVVGAGGPNVVPADDPWVAQCVARAPGGPTHVMLDDRIAEHVPGCNMAFRRFALLAINGFNPMYRRAGDDVDICWRLQAKGFRIGFAPSAIVWHHRRASVMAYWRQQAGYGEAETCLDAHHPEKFLGRQMLWRGRIYSPLPFLQSATRMRVNTGVWGTASFPSVYGTPNNQWRYLPHSPAWIVGSSLILLVGLLGEAVNMGAPWLPLSAGVLGWTATLGRCVWFAWRSDLGPDTANQAPPHLWDRLRRRLLIAWLHLVQPLARFWGQLDGLSRPPTIAPQHATRQPWKTPVPSLRDAWLSARLFAARGEARSFWSETTVARTMLLDELVRDIRASRPAQVVEIDEGWWPDRDLSLAIGRWGWLHVRTLVEEHERGRTLLRVRARLRPSVAGTVRGVALAVLLVAGMSASMALYQPSISVAVALTAIPLFGARAGWQAARAAVVLNRALTRVTTAAGMVPLPVSANPAEPVGRSAETTFSRSA